MIVVLDEDRAITYHRPSADRVLGYDEGERVGEYVLEYVHPEDRSCVVDALDSIDDADTTMDDADATSLHVRIRHADGLWVPVEATVSDPDDAGSVVVNARESTDRNAFGALHELYEIASATDPSFDDKCARVLDLGRQRLGLPYAFLTRITEDTQTIVAAKGDHERGRRRGALRVRRNRSSADVTVVAMSPFVSRLRDHCSPPPERLYTWGLRSSVRECPNPTPSLSPTPRC